MSIEHLGSNSEGLFEYDCFRTNCNVCHYTLPACLNRPLLECSGKHAEQSVVQDGSTSQKREHAMFINVIQHILVITMTSLQAILFANDEQIQPVVSGGDSEVKLPERNNRQNR